MIEEVKNFSTIYHIKGFRSLVDFEIELNPGLNALVGPNGSGKTNFIEILDFISAFIEVGATRAITQAGGIGRVFSQETYNKRSACLEITVKGVARLDRTEDYFDDQTLYLRFEYLVKVVYSRKEASVYISTEQLRFKKPFWYSDPKQSNFLGFIKVTRRRFGERPKVDISPKLLKMSWPNPLVEAESRIGRSLAESTLRDLIPPYLLEQDQSLFLVRRRLQALNAVANTFNRSQSFNIIPARVRAPDEITRPPVIGRDGSGLSATLMYLKSLKTGALPPARRRAGKADGATLDSLIGWTRLVLPELKEIDVVSDFNLGVFVTSFALDNSKIKIPLRSMSDGTLKWLAILALILTSRSFYSLEEPENFLHPKMQEYLVSIIRDAIEGFESPPTFILSTHSETMINHILPEELILFEFIDGSTSCRRLMNPNTVVKQINKTGFGLGYYYANNSLS